MPRLNFLTDTERESFDNIQELSDEERKKFFAVTDEDKKGSYFRKDSTALYFTILRGYFLAFGKFFQLHQFREEDIVYVKGVLDIATYAHKNDYPKATYHAHKKIIAKHFGFTLFKDWKNRFEFEADQLVKTTLKPKQIFYSLIDVLYENKVEIPSYYVFAETITNSLNNFESDLINRIDHSLTEDQKEMLEVILKMAKNQDEDLSPSNPYLVTTIKKPEQSTAPGKIRQSLKDFDIVAQLYNEFSGFLSELSLSDQLINYHAVWLIKSKHIVFLSISEPSKKYLYLLSFIVYQYRIRQDLFVDTLLKAVQKFQNDVDKGVAEDFLNQKPVRLEQTKKVIGMVRSLSEQVDYMREVAFSLRSNDSEKVKQIKNMFGDLDNSKADRIAERERVNKELEKLELSFSASLKEQMQYDGYIQGYRRIQNRVFGILQILDFNAKTSDHNIIEAISFLKKVGRKVPSRKSWPLNFLSQKDKKRIRTIEEENIAYSLYKVIVFFEVSNHLKAGSLNLSNSEKYRAVEEYLIPDIRWEKSKEVLLKRAEIPLPKDCSKFLIKHINELNVQYRKTNSNIYQNHHLSFTSNGKPKVNTPKVEKEEGVGLLPLLEEENVFPLPQILTDIDQSTNFLKAFAHFSQKNFQKPPSQELFLAAIIALGCNIGIRKMSKISKGIKTDKLAYLVQWYFSKENLDSASSIINDAINELSLPEVHQRNKEEMHTSSDGQKFNVSAQSLHASHSFKYFGSGKGVTAYSFIDEYSRLFYNTVISSSEREAAYVIDGLMHNENVESDIHSTDTHGYSEIVFAISNCLGVFFAPRIKNYKDQLLYTFKDHPKKEYQSEKFMIAPTGSTYIDAQLIEEQWDNILRVIVSIKLKETTASRILKRLSSYSKQHPLYKALKQVGRVFKSIFILRYLDDLTLRQATEKVLNRVEQSHQFAKAVFFGNNQEIKQSTKEEQEIAVGARHLVQNAIVLWNYLKISENLANCDDKKEFDTMLETVKNGSIMTWQHINIHGEYDFGLIDHHDDKKYFEMDQLRALQLN